MPATFVPRAEGALDVGVSLRDGATHIARLRQAGCLKCIFPRIFRTDAEAVMVNTSGGVTGGDVLRAGFDLGAGARLTVTTQAAERIYKTTDATLGRITTRAQVGAGAQLHWLPQETILFDRAALHRDLEVDLAPDATFLMCETLVFGRAAMGETLRAAQFEDRVRITRGGAPLYLDGISLSGDVAAQMARASCGAGAGAVATAVLVAARAQDALAQIRALLPATAGASVPRAGVLVVRALAADSLALRRFMIPVLERLAGQPLPAVWRL